MKHHHPVWKFTMVELLVIIAVIAILAGMLLPALNNARNRVKSMSCMNHLKQLGTNAFMYSNDSREWILPSRLYTHETGGGGTLSWGEGIWFRTLARYAGQKSLDWSYRSTVAKVYLCPNEKLPVYKSSDSTSKMAYTHYSVNTLLGGDTSLGTQPPYHYKKLNCLLSPSEAFYLVDQYSETYSMIHVRYMGWRHHSGELREFKPEPADFAGTPRKINLQFMDGHVASAGFQDFKKRTCPNQYYPAIGNIQSYPRNMYTGFDPCK